MRIRIFVQCLSLLALTSAAATAAPPPGVPDGWSEGYAHANGARLHYYHAVPAPDKPVIVMVHGVTDNGLCWTTLTWKLQDSYNIYMLDTRSHGLSDPIAPTDDGDTLIKDVVAFVKAMRFDKPILMGHSMGAATVMRIGAEYPDLAKAIVMLDPGLPRAGGAPGGRRGGPPGAGGGRRGGPPAGGRRGGDGGEREEAAGPPPGENTTPERLSFSMSGAPETLVAQNNYSYEALVAKCRRDNPKWGEVDCQYWALSKRQYHGAFSSEMFGVMSGSMATGDSLSKITVPAIVLKADTSPEGRTANEESAKVIQKGKLVHIDNAGHNLHHDQLEKSTEVIKEFLSAL